MKLGDILEFGNGKPVHSLEKGKYPIYGGNGILGYCNDFLYENVLIIGRVGANCGSVAKCNGPCWVSDNAIAAKVKDSANNDYIFYLLSQMDLNKKHIGAAQPLITQGIIRELSVSIPDLPTQDAIASVLSSLDRKISLNRKANEVLESMAKQLYDYWFVQFDFPNAEGKPYKSSGGKMVYNETLKREIPEGWEECTLRYYIKKITNGLNPRKNFVLGEGNNYYVTIKSLTGSDIDWENCDRCDDEALAKINSRSDLQVGDIIFSAIGTIGKTYRIYEKPTNWNISETSFTIRREEGVPEDFFYSLLRCDEIQVKADKAAVGSTMRCLVMDPLCDVVYFKVPQKTMELYSKFVHSYYLRIYQNNKETLRLNSLRDYLLPLLMNGQVKVS